MGKNIIIVVLAFIVIALVLNSIFGWFHQNTQDRMVQEVLKPQTDTIYIEKVKLSNGMTDYQYSPNVGQLPQNNLTENYTKYVQDTLAPALKLKKEDLNNGNVTEIKRVETQSKDVVPALISIIDSLKNLVTEYKTKYFWATTTTDSLGNSKLRYEYNATLDFVTEQKRKGWKDYLVTHITSPDTNLVINHVEHFKRETYIKPRRFGVGVQAGYHYVPPVNKFYPTIGVGISYDLFRF